MFSVYIDSENQSLAKKLSAMNSINSNFKYIWRCWSYRLNLNYFHICSVQCPVSFSPNSGRNSITSFDHHVNSSNFISAENQYIFKSVAIFGVKNESSTFLIGDYTNSIRTVSWLLIHLLSLLSQIFSIYVIKNKNRSGSSCRKNQFSYLMENAN